MQDKHKVTLYLPPDLHRQLKVRSAVEMEPMSSLAERAIVFYLTHAEVVNELEQSHGQAHRIYSCPACTTALVLRQGDIVPVNQQSGILAETDLSPEEELNRTASAQDEEELVPC